MMHRWFACAVVVMASVAVSGCVEPGPARGAAVESDSVATSELTSGQTCFTCELDPSIHACSSIASRADSAGLLGEGMRVPGGTPGTSVDGYAHATAWWTLWRGSVVGTP